VELNFKHALVALDQSDASDIIIDCLGYFKQFGTKKFTLFTSVSVSYPGGLSQKSEERFSEKLEEYRQRLEPLGIEIETEAAFKTNAYAPTQILNAANEHQADFIIIANRGYNKFREFLLGSTATELLQRCDLPVYLINLSVSDETNVEDRKLYCVKSCQQSLHHIFYPTDFSSTADRAFSVLKNLVSEKTENITLLHVQATGRPGVDDPDQLEEFDKIDMKRLDSLKKELQPTSNAEIEILIRHGSPSKQILENAEMFGATMIILGSQGRGYVSDLFLGGVSLQVIRKAHIPVLTVPADRNNEINPE